MHIIVNDNSDETKVLRTVGQDVQFPLSGPIKALVKDLKAQLFDLGGVGLAAPQVGVSQRLFAVFIPEEMANIREHATVVPMTVFFNPEYIKEPDSELVLDWEACYSVKDLMGKVPRHFRIRFLAQDEEGKPISFIAFGHYARVLQHETDHTNGKLCDELMLPYPKGSFAEMNPIRRSELSLDKQKLFDELRKKQTAHERKN